MNPSAALGAVFCFACGGTELPEVCEPIGWQCEGASWTWSSTGRGPTLIVGLSEDARALQPAFEEAATWWQRELETDRPVFVFVPMLKVQPEIIDIDIELEAMNLSISGYTIPSTTAVCGSMDHALVRLRPAIKKKYLVGIILHELGHTLGLEHEAGGAMSCDHSCGARKFACALSVAQREQALASLGV